ncbi:holdfast anchoring protein HfaA [Maricaulis sp.]|jgi:holdfast attachment protein HfaA|uniref:holdfast anchoring protein HfaA n=1 Tax=Maricaulis sp. TaxID=1486257 RepID=UPI0032981609
MTLRKFPPASAAVLAVTVLASAAQAQQAETTAGWEIPYGSRTTATSSQAWSGAGASAGAAARSEAGNRVIIDGVIQTGVGVSSQGGLFGGGVGSGATAIGNQLNVNVSGRYNTVIINSTQINNGDINANANANGNVSTDNDQD